MLPMAIVPACQVYLFFAKHAQASERISKPSAEDFKI
jgi:hypothetical protein